MEELQTVFCVVPVHNRLEITKKFMNYINTQDYPYVKIVIIDDGSVDGTGEYLSQLSQKNIIVMKGDGNLWWSKATQIGIDYVKRNASKKDFLLLINDDVDIGEKFISSMVMESKGNNFAVVGSTQLDEASGNTVNCGWHIDYWAMSIVKLGPNDDKGNINALSGRGVLIPMSAVFQVGDLHTKLFPHYLSDLEYTARIGEAGWPIVTSKVAGLFTSSESSDIHTRSKGAIPRYFSIHSKSNLLSKFLLFCVRGPILSRVSAFIRFPFIIFISLIRRCYEKME